MTSPMSANPTPPAGPMEQKPCQHRALRSYDVPVCKDCGAVDWNALPDAALARRPLSAPDATAPLLTTSNDGKAGVVASGVTHVVYPAPDATGGDDYTVERLARAIAGVAATEEASGVDGSGRVPVPVAYARTLLAALKLVRRVAPFSEWLELFAREIETGVLQSSDRARRSYVIGLRSFAVSMREIEAAALAVPPLPVAREMTQPDVTKVFDREDSAFLRRMADSEERRFHHPGGLYIPTDIPRDLHSLADRIEGVLGLARSAPHPAAGKREEDAASCATCARETPHEHVAPGEWGVVYRVPEPLVASAMYLARKHDAPNVYAKLSAIVTPSAAAGESNEQ